MWSAIRWLVLRLAAVRWLFKLGWLGLFMPIAFLLKLIGIPIMAVLSIVALPVLFLLFLFGLPIFLVLTVGGLLMGLIGTAITIGFAALKFFIVVVLPIWLVFVAVQALYRWTCKRRDGDKPTPPTPPPPPSTPGDFDVG